MYRLNLPPFEIKIRETNGRHSVWDILRRKYVALTPEEWVRQHFVHYLIGHKGYPQSLLANETELRMGAKRLRCDTVLYDKLLHPRMIMEYKAPAIALSQA
ncbi:type I restriction enzyme HsdR N-terminal domain-containing protein, partial [Bacteroides heparinolyticus]|uniref:type I restriction enzyme HsdR N-terminal domain-containing protein n=1 Tax=Prevotella heparinolytica TaxID=28113 RepID=UPI0035A04D64